ncbi:MAG TPA: PKD domain-containing protein, partial [Chitinophagales bacterium]|nr:PKD domain-containing protein [Chitinophagales bacterium]
SNSPISGNKTEGNQGGSDYWVMKFTSVNDNPLAVDFSLPTTNCVSEPLTFTNNSNGNTYQWLIDGLFVSNDADLNYSFAQPGAYTITLIGANSICNDTSTRIFNIAAPSTINYSSSVNGSTVYLSALGANNCAWDFGDGTSSNNITTQHTYSIVGTYEVCLTYTVECGTFSTCNSITTQQLPNCPSVGSVMGQNTIGGNGIDQLACFQPTADGGYILGGYSHSNISGDKTEAVIGGDTNSADYWVVKLSATNAIEWQNTIGGDGHDRLTCLQQTADGGYILGGYSGSDISGDKTENIVGNDIYYDYWVVKLSANGTIQWQNTIGGGEYDYLQSIEQTTDGGYILGGYSRSNMSIDKTENVVGYTVYYDYWVVKLSANGTIQWQNTIGGFNHDYLKSIKQTADGGYILGGYSNSGVFGDKTEANQGYNDYWVVKLSATGTIQWQNTIGGNYEDYLESIEQTADGGYILGGYSSSGISGDKTEISQSGDYWVVKLAATGTIEWQNTIGGSNEDYLKSIEQTTDGGYILGGYSKSGISGDKTVASKGGYDYWVVKVSNSGTIQWQNTIGGNSDDFLQCIQQTTDNNYVLAGYSKSNASGDKNEGSIGLEDYWIVKIKDDIYASADFQTPPIACKNGIVMFNNTSNELSTSYQWQIDGVPVSTNTNLSYSFATIGTHTVTLVADNDSCTSSKSRNIKIVEPKFICTNNGLNVHLEANGNNEISHTWDFGDGNTAIGTTVNHTYNNPGIYTICLTDECGNSDCQSVQLYISNYCLHRANVEGQNTIGGNLEDLLAFVQQTSDGGYIAGGYSSSSPSDDKTEGTVGGGFGTGDYWVVKFSSLDTIEWQNTIGSDGLDYLQSLYQTADGGYILGGYSNSGSGDKTEISKGGYDYWIVKISATGTIEGQNTIGGNNDDYLQSIQQTTDGGYILGGYSKSGVSGDKTEGAIGSYNYNDYWIVKLAGNGTIQWQNTIGGSSEDYLQSLQQTTDGGYILAGYSNSSISGDKTTAPKGASDYWVVKLSTTGTIEWQNTIGGSGYEQLEAIQQTTDGGYILGGASSSGISGDKTEASKGSSDYWVVKISNVGDVSWERTIGGNGSDYLQDIQQTIDGGYILGGSSTSGISGDKTEASYPDFFGLGAGDFWIVKLSDINTNPPLAQFTAPIATFLYAPTTFTNTTTDYINTPNAGTTPSSYQWLIDNVPIATSTHLTYTFTEPGIHDITLVADNGDCVDTYNQLITVLDKGVWPGDANNDGTVSMLDYLAWGIAVDYVDIPRLDQSIDWSPKFAGDYNQNFGGDLWSNTNYKHADCNGNGVINGSDTTAIVQNFGLSYLPTPPLVNNTTPQATLTLENNTPLIAANALASFSLQLQNTLNGGVVNAYGLAFTLHYNGIENPSLDFSESCWGIIGTDFHVLLIPDANNHQIHVGITRTDHNNRLLLGEVLELQGIVTAALGSNVTVSLSDIVLLNAEAYQIPAVGTDAAMQVSNSTPPILLEVKTLLQCSVTDVSISNSLMTNNYSNTLPTQQPFNTAPWNYNGSENGTIPANAVDWMLLELRNATNQVVGRKAVLLLSNGYLQEVGTPLQANRIALYGVDVLQ